ncbi:NlpC/P60 family protein [Rothia halotolerans]|uniref:NlpC/P60 family protein n=1 Tax=Rothia halotolerans TaxID=405770 RepID=UPI001EDE4C10|nr:NlpC/P60 family protein [Rothia halotolerans]
MASSTTLSKNSARAAGVLTISGLMIGGIALAQGANAAPEVEPVSQVTADPVLSGYNQEVGEAPALLARPDVAPKTHDQIMAERAAEDQAAADQAAADRVAAELVAADQAAADQAPADEAAAEQTHAPVIDEVAASDELAPQSDAEPVPFEAPAPAEEAAPAPAAEPESAPAEEAAAPAPAEEPAPAQPAAEVETASTEAAEPAPAAQPAQVEVETAADTTPAPAAEPAQAEPAAEPAAQSSGSYNGAAVVSAAKSQIGVQQDCTALVSNALRSAGINFHGWPADYQQLGHTVSAGEAKPGDLIYYASNGMGQSHIAVYIGNGQAIHGGWEGGTTAQFSADLPAASSPVYISVDR